MKFTTLAALVEALDELDDEFTIYAARPDGWRADSAAIAAVPSGDGSLPPEATGLVYFLEVPLAKEAIRVWSDWRGGTLPSASDRLQAVIHYAENDAFLPLQQE